jgi:GNAT superfamily N-acetyltransferase/predicted nucleic acid-binding protein
MIIIETLTTTKQLNSVEQIAKKNSQTIGHMPRGGFEDAMQRGHILIALDETQRVVGYLLYRVAKTKYRASITHLCVDQEFQGRGIGRKLVDRLKEITKHLRGISLYSKRTLPSHQLWPRLGFTFRWEKPGRGSDRATLTEYWYDHQHPNLLRFANASVIESKAIKVVIDANIFYDLLEGKQEESNALMSDWLIDELVLIVTPEIRNEINRNDDRHSRKRSLSFANNFPEVNYNRAKYEHVCYNLEQTHFANQTKASHDSDKKQLAYTIASNVPIFVTRDERLLKLKAALDKEHSLTVMRPTELIVRLDELINSTRYQASRLAGTRFQCSLITSGEVEALEDHFLNPQENESRREFTRKLRQLFVEPATKRALGVRDTHTNEIIALMIVDESDPNILAVPILRTATNHRLGLSATQYLLLNELLELSRTERNLVVIKDDNLQSQVRDTLLDSGFIPSEALWFKFSVNQSLTIESTTHILKDLASRFRAYSSYLETAIRSLDNSNSVENSEEFLEIEQSFWPLKIVDAPLKTFLVPIQPLWASHLFDTQLGSEMLWGSDPIRMLSNENVYYRSAKTRTIIPGSRIIWYVSGSQKGQRNVMQARAISYVDDVHIDAATNLFKKFEHLGIYQWRDVLALAKSDPHRPIMGIEFSNTSLLKKGVPLKQLVNILGWKPTATIMSPVEITTSQFAQILIYADNP